MSAPERVYIAWPNAQSCGLAFTRPADNRTEYTRTPDPLLAKALEALRYYANTFCEGFCADLPQAGTYHESMDDHCSGCKARALVAKMEER